MNIETTLLREKFVINELRFKDDSALGESIEIIAASNRIEVTLEDGEKYIVRAQNMHSCVRMAAMIIECYKKNGTLEKYTTPTHWAGFWNKTLNAHERNYNKKKWIVVYNKGKVAFKEGAHHPFFDIIEKFHTAKNQDYKASLALAETSFSESGKHINLNYDANIALVAAVKDKNVRCGLLLRGPDIATFNYTITANFEHQNTRLPLALNMAANFLEGIQLSYTIGRNRENIATGQVEKMSEQYKMVQSARTHLRTLNDEINVLEQKHKTIYRPGRPNFNDLIDLTAEEQLKSAV